jgi:hypothetical protein
MPDEPPPWTLESLIDLEQEIATSAGTSAEVRSAVVSAVRGLEGAVARRVGFRVWLDQVRKTSAGRRFSSGLAMVTGGLALVAFFAGISAVLGLLDRERGGVSVVLFTGILIGGQWLVLLLAGLAALMRRSAWDGFSGIQAAVVKLVKRTAGDRDAWWTPTMAAAGPARAAVLWRVLRLVQTVGIFFNVGILTGLAGLVMVKHVGFFWETTTESAMRVILEDAVRFLSIPWSWWWPGAVPDPAVIEASRWLPSRLGGLGPGPSSWWEFLLMTTIVWGLLPRAVLWVIAWMAGRKALANLDFQGRHHRVLWRELTGDPRSETDEKPLDGVLVLDVGGSGVAQEELRPFLLRRLRVHPTAWHTTAVLDLGAEDQTALALRKAPAGVVLLAEGWALSPPRMTALHTRIRAAAGPLVPVKFLVVNVDSAKNPAPPAPEERREWERFVDSLGDPAAEVFCFEVLQPAV